MVYCTNSALSNPEDRRKMFKEGKSNASFNERSERRLEVGGVAPKFFEDGHFQTPEMT